MGQDLLQYDQLVDTALRGVVRAALERVAAEGLRGPHHFLISFRTGEPGVVIAESLKARYPAEMTIVIQYQYWDLDVGPDRFSVTLTFNKSPQRLTVPYSALTGFSDPGVKFGLRFQGAIAPAEPVPAAPAEVVQGEAAGAPPPDDGAKVVALDAFRKK